MASAGQARKIEIEIPYSPRAQFVPYHERTHRWAVLVAHRRAGKTVATINELIMRALVCKLPRPRVAYIAPLFKQAKAVAWDYLKHYTQNIPGAMPHEGELRVDLPNGGQVRLYGADNPDALRGIYLDDVVLDEYAQMRGRLWEEVIRPCLADREGRATFIGTPMGRNDFCALWERGLVNPSWFTLMLKASESGLIASGELEDAKLEMTDDQYAQEFECSFAASVIGSYYGHLMAAAEEDERLTSVEWEPALPVHTAWDLGIGDSTAIWFAQVHGNQVRLIDFYEASGVGLSHYVGEIFDRRAKGWLFGDHILPHDADISELGTGKKRIHTLSEMGLYARVLPRDAVDDGIDAARLLIPRCWFDANRCARGIEALRQYRREYDEKLKAFRMRPLHDWTSHAADAFRYLAMGLDSDIERKIARERYRRIGRGPSDLTWMSI